MFRPSSVGHHQVISIIRGNYTIYDTLCNVKPLVFNEISFSSIKSYYNTFFKIPSKSTLVKFYKYFIKFTVLNILKKICYNNILQMKTRSR
jgi:hypothetical protein